MGRVTGHVTRDRPCNAAYDMRHVAYVTYDVTYNRICKATRDVRSAAFLATLMSTKTDAPDMT